MTRPESTDGRLRGASPYREGAIREIRGDLAGRFPL